MTLAFCFSARTACVPLGWCTISLYLVAHSQGRPRAYVDVQQHAKTGMTEGTPSALTLFKKKVKIYFYINTYMYLYKYRSTLIPIVKSIKVKDKSIINV